MTVLRRLLCRLVGHRYTGQLHQPQAAPGCARCGVVLAAVLPPHLARGGEGSGGGSYDN